MILEKRWLCLVENCDEFFEDNFEIKIPIMISENNLKNGFVPEVGKSINCGLWLCGVVNE